MIIGVAGKYCAGKDAVVSILKGHGLTELDEDRIGHESLEANHDSVVHDFGDKILAETGKIDRRKLGALVFSSTLELQRLEAIVHPWMVDETRRRAQEAGGDVVINAAILFKMRLHLICDHVFLVTAPMFLRIVRGAARDDISLRQVIKRVYSQRTFCVQKQFLNETGSRVDTVVVRNSGSISTLEKRIAGILSSL